MAREHLAGVAKARVPFTSESSSVLSLRTWTQPFLGVFVLLVAFVAAVGAWKWVSAKTSSLTGHQIPTLDQQMMAITASQG